jgi:hypothetical protein
MNEFFTKNVDGTFEPVGYEFTGWPANGIWLVEDSRQSLIYPYEGVEKKPTPSLISYLQYQNELQEHLTQQWKDKPLSIMDIAAISCEFFAIKAGAISVLGEIIEN